MSQRPLSLKRERAQKPNHPRVSNLIAEVLVDHEIFHLNHPFSYGIPDSMREHVHVGSKVRIPFRNSEKAGVVTAIRPGDESVKSISKVVNSWAFSKSSIELAKEVAHRYGSHELEILNAIPSHSTSPWPIGETAIRKKGERSFIAMREKSLEGLLSHLETSKGSSLVIFPTEREAYGFYSKALLTSNRECLNYFGAHSSKVLRELESKMRSGEKLIVIGCRSSIFLQISNLEDVVIIDEQSEDYWELRRPYWNVRDVALIRSQLEGLRLTFLSSAPSLELTRLIELGFIKNERRLPKLSRRYLFSFEEEGYIRVIREGLASGPVLVSVAEKSYSGSFLCSKCRNSPRCSCGALLGSKSKDIFECRVCGFTGSGWSCTECGGSKVLFLRKGAERIHEELGKSFPRTPIFISTADKPITEVGPGSIVIATPGMHPTNIQYGALVLLDGWLFLNRPGIRAEEYLRRFWFRLLSQAKSGARIYLSLPRSHGISQDLLQGNALKGSRRQLMDRSITKLPPAYRLVLITGRSASDIALNLKNEFPEIELSRTNDSSSIVLRAKVEETQLLVDALVALQRYRSAARRELLRIQVDPYDL